MSVNVSVIFQLLLLAFVEKCLMKDEPYFYKEEWFDKVWILKKLKFKKDAQDLKASRPTEIECNCTNLNITQAETSRQNATVDDMAFRVTKIIFYVIIFLLSCVGNTLVVFIILGTRDMRTPSNFLTLKLALCDLITPAVLISHSKKVSTFGVLEKHYASSCDQWKHLSRMFHLWPSRS